MATEPFFVLSFCCLAADIHTYSGFAIVNTFMPANTVAAVFNLTTLFPGFRLGYNKLTLPPVASLQYIMEMANTTDGSIIVLCRTTTDDYFKAGTELPLLGQPGQRDEGLSFDLYVHFRNPPSLKHSNNITVDFLQLFRAGLTLDFNISAPAAALSDAKVVSPGTLIGQPSLTRNHSQLTLRWMLPQGAFNFTEAETNLNLSLDVMDDATGKSVEQRFVHHYHTLTQSSGNFTAYLNGLSRIELHLNLTCE